MTIFDSEDVDNLEDIYDDPDRSLAEELGAGPEEVFDPAQKDFYDKIIDKTWDFIVFFADIEGFPYKYQEEFGKTVIKSIIYEETNTLTALMARQIGKSETVANIIAGCMILMPRLSQMFPNDKILSKWKRGFWVGCFAPTEEQVDIVFTRVIDRLTSDHAQEVMNDPDIKESLVGKSKFARLSSGSSVRMQTANPRAKIEGRTYHLIIIDEAQDVDAGVVRKSIRPMATNTGGSLVMIGTPATHKGIFYETIQTNKRRELSRGGKQTHYEYNWVHCAKYNYRYKKAVREAAEEMGEDSDEFRLSYKLEWLLDRGMFITEDQFNALCDTAGDLVPSYFTSPVIVGIDPARKLDSTVVTVVLVDWDHPDYLGLMQHRVLNWLEMHGEDWEEQYFKIKEFLSAYNVLGIAVDGQGVGDAIAQRLQVLMPNTEVFAIMSDNKTQAERWKHLMTLVQRGEISWPGNKKLQTRNKMWRRFRQQMQDAEKNYKNGHMIVEAPEGKDSHDDFVDSLALACILSRDFIVPEVEATDNPFYRK
jgi:hypothetical protein